MPSDSRIKGLRSLDTFSMLSGVGISYKTIERLYSDDEVIIAIHNLHALILKRKKVTNSDATCDGTGYSLTVKKNYESHAQKLKDMAKMQRNQKVIRNGCLHIPLH